MEIVAKENKVTIMDHEEGSLTEEFVEDPMTIPRRISEGWKAQITSELPETFCGKELCRGFEFSISILMVLFFNSQFNHELINSLNIRLNQTTTEDLLNNVMLSLLYPMSKDIICKDLKPL